MHHHGYAQLAAQPLQGGVMLGGRVIGIADPQGVLIFEGRLRCREGNTLLLEIFRCPSGDPTRIAARSFGKRTHNVCTVKTCGGA